MNEKKVASTATTATQHKKQLQQQKFIASSIFIYIYISFYVGWYKGSARKSQLQDLDEIFEIFVERKNSPYSKKHTQNKQNKSDNNREGERERKALKSWFN